jgi:branched-chain amino acid aminotransferase
MSANGPAAGPTACLDGELMAAEQARIPVTDEGLLRGDGVFEVARLYDGEPFALGEHLARMERSAENLRLEFDRELVEADIGRLLAAADRGDGLLRALLTRGGHRVTLLEPLPEVPASIALGCVTYAPTHVMDGIKSLSYAANMLASRLAREHGFDEALFVSPEGRVLEAPTASFFWVSSGQLLTPPLSEHVLDSITRRLIIDDAGGREQTATLAELGSAEEAFIASSVREVLPVHRVEDHHFPPDGPVTSATADTVREHIRAALGRATPA